MTRRALIISNSADATSDYLCNRLRQADIPFVRYNTDTDAGLTRFVYREARPTVSWREHEMDPDRIGAVIVRRPKPVKPVSEGDPFDAQHAAREWAEAWEGFLAHLPESGWINHPAQNFKASHKIEQLTRARKLGLRIPETLVTNEPMEAKLFVQKRATGTIVKPLATGYIERLTPSEDTVIYTRDFTAEHHFLFDTITDCPVLFQERIDKALDVRMVVLDNEIVSVGMEARDTDGTQRLDIRRNNMCDVSYSTVNVPDGIATQVCALLKGYGLRFAALDFAIAADGAWVFFEINPNGQWAWLDLQADTNIAGLFESSLRHDLTVRG